MLGGDLGRRRRGRGLDGEEWDVGGALRGRSGLDEAGDSEEFVLVPLGREVPEIRIWTPNGHRFAYRRRKEN